MAAPRAADDPGEWVRGDRRRSGQRRKGGETQARTGSRSAGIEKGVGWQSWVAAGRVLATNVAAVPHSLWPGLSQPSVSCLDPEERRLEGWRRGAYLGTWLWFGDVLGGRER